MPEVHRVSVEIGGTEISFETGWMAKQASGAVVVRAGDTVVLATATAGNVRDVDFLPLTVDVEERMYAAGKIPGSFFKREGRAGEKATLIARMIDRPLRPLFPKGWRRETQLVGMPLSVDQVHAYDVLAMNGASAALQISDIPFPEPVGAVRIGKIDGNFVINPTEEALLESDLDLVVSGTEEAILMVEAGANEVPEAEILDALDIAHSEIKKLVAAQHELRAKAGKPKLEIEVPQADEGLVAQIAERYGERLDQATSVEDKLERQAATKVLEEEALEEFAGPPEADTYVEYRLKAQVAFDALEKKIIRERIAVQKKRPDGRQPDEIRAIDVQIKPLPRTHGSALFTRGQTQALSVVALGTTREEMRLDNLGLETSKRYFHHYNFPPFSVGEAGFMRGPKRRDIGHGALAERALVPMIPDQETFPYTIRVVDGLRVRLDAVADGRRRADQGAGGRHRDGPDQGGRRLRRAVRHRGRRRPPRRHGLQGRRHREGHHRPPDGHQDHGRHVRDPA
jgi:polyribonucleotide nucleotidyltransferase